MPPSPTIRDIALKAGVSRTTVSDALRGRASVAPDTKAKILQIAAEMGYQRDARVGELMTYLRHHKTRQDRIPLAWVHAQSRDRFTHMAVWREMFQGAESRATELGYSLEAFSLDDRDIHASRLSSILYSRGISGIVMSPPFDAPEWLEADWSPFTCIQVSVDPLDHTYPSVAPDRRFAIQEIWNRLSALGYERISLVLKTSADHRVDDAFASQYMWESSPYSRDAHIPILCLTKTEALNPECPRLRSWLSDHHPDVIITNFGSLSLTLDQMGMSVPDHIGLALTNIEEGNDYYSGVTQLNRVIGANAIDLLTMQLNYRKGEHTQFLSSVRIKGMWRPGKTTVNLAADKE